MKALFLSCLATAALLSFSACEADGEHRHDHDHDRGGSTTTTTTEETTTRHPVEATTETHTIRAY